VLGVGFSIALAFGNTVGVGILRLPGTVAAALGDARLVIAVWIVGGLYAVLGAISVGELASMMPRAGGFYVYARRAFGARTGFAIAWNDWILNCVTVAYAALTAVDFLAALAPGAALHGQWIGIAIVASFTALQWLGIRIGGNVQNLISAAVGALLVALAIGCFTLPAALAPTTVTVTGGPPLTLLSVGLVAAVATSLRSVIVTYDGWYGAIYLAEETVDAARSVPRAMISCAALVTALYVLINLGLLHALPMAELEQSTLPAAAVAARILPQGGSQFVTVVSLLTILGVINAVLLSAPRILFAVGRDGLLNARTAQVGAGGTPQMALGLTSLCSALLILSGTLEQLLAIAAVIFVLNYISAYVAVFVLRWSAPQAERPFRAWGFPLGTAIVLAGSLAFLALSIQEDPRSAGRAALLMALSLPLHWWTQRRSR
jgi:APA family basic amino acid/polyamine antiporter